MLKLRSLHAIAGMIAFGLFTPPVRAQLVRQCTSGSPVAPSGAPQSVVDALQRVTWRSSLADYTAIIAKDGALAAFDSLDARSRALLLLSGDGGGRYAADTANLHARMAALRTVLIQALAVRDTSRVSYFGDLRPITTLNPNEVLFVLQGAARTRLTFDPAAPMPAIALCASSMSAWMLLDFVTAPLLSASAADFATALHRWDLFVQRGYSMTLWERLGASCRLGFAGWIVSPTTMASGRCGEKLQRLGPPTAQTIFMHPSAGIMPVRDSSGSFRSITLVEVYGFVFHRYTATSIQSFGLGGVIAYADQGPVRYGVVLHTPPGAITLVDARGPNAKAHRVIVSADVLGWMTSMRDKARSVEAVALGIVASQKLP
ncbi:MAG TPA: hypothetical protein VN706_19135 [Gemmatimonadaceae bacterium]|nr:hypothetical protein [Gemmatimonadaceae bacterium]